MKTIFSAFLFLVFCGASSDVFGQVQSYRHTFVSASGLDSSSTCSRTAPCRQIQRAINLTLADGSVTVLDSGEYQNFLINRSMRVAAEPGAIATIVATAGVYTAIRVGGTSAINATIKGFVIGDSNSGIVTENQIGNLYVEDCYLTTLMSGLSFTSGGRYYVNNVHVKNGNYGLWISTTQTETQLTLQNSSFRNTNLIAIYLGQNSVSTIVGTTVDGNLNDSIGGNENAKFLVDRCIITNNDSDGISINAGMTGRVSDSIITNNTGYGIRNNGGTARTFGNNRITSNGAGNFYGTVSSVSLL